MLYRITIQELLMHNTIVMSLLVTAGLSLQGMNHNLSYGIPLFPLTEHICVGHDWNAARIGSDINALSLTNKFLYDYYTHEPTEQYIIGSVARKNKITDYESARLLGCKKIQAKINYFCETASDPNKKFTADDLKAYWYFNSTMIHTPLLNALIIVRDVKKIKTLVKAGIVITNKTLQSPFVVINELKTEPDRINVEQDDDDLAYITLLLIKYKTYPFK